MNTKQNVLYAGKVVDLEFISDNTVDVTCTVRRALTSQDAMTKMRMNYFWNLTYTYIRDETIKNVIS